MCAPWAVAQINMDTHDLEMKILGNDGNIISKVQLDQLKPEMCLAVAFGPVAEEGKGSTVRLVGSSVEKTEKRTRRASKDLWDEDNPLGVNDVQKGGVGMEELNLS